MAYPHNQTVKSKGNSMLGTKKPYVQNMGKQHMAVRMAVIRKMFTNDCDWTSRLRIRWLAPNVT